MAEDIISNSKVRSRWFIALDWYQQSNRSLSTLVESRLCSKCREHLEGREGSIEELLSNIRECCSKNPNFITPETPILESIFRLFLANGNQPLNLEELGERLRERRSGDIYPTSVEVLSRLLHSDRCYGLREVSD